MDVLERGFQSSCRQSPSNTNLDGDTVESAECFDLDTEGRKGRGSGGTGELQRLNCRRGQNVIKNNCKSDNNTW